MGSKNTAEDRSEVRQPNIQQLYMYIQYTCIHIYVYTYTVVYMCIHVYMYIHDVHV